MSEHRRHPRPASLRLGSAQGRAPPPAPASSSGRRRTPEAVPAQALAMVARRLEQFGQAPPCRPRPAHKARPRRRAGARTAKQLPADGEQQGAARGNRFRIYCALEQRRPARFDPGELLAADPARQQSPGDCLQPRLSRRRSAVERLERSRHQASLIAPSAGSVERATTSPIAAIQRPQRGQRRARANRRVEQRQLTVGANRRSQR